MLEKRKLRVLLVGAEKSGKSFFFNKVLDTVKDQYDQVFLDDEIWEEEGVRKIEKTYIFDNSSVTVELVDIDEVGLAVKEILEKNERERQKADAIIFLYSMLRRGTFDVLSQDLLGPTVDILREKYKDQKLAAYPFVIYGTEKDKLGITVEKSSANVVSDQEANQLCFSHDGLFALQNSSLHSIIVDRIINDLVKATFQVQGVVLQQNDGKPNASSTGFFSRFKSMAFRRKKTLKHEEDT